MTSPTAPPPPDRRFLRLLIDLSDFADIVIRRFAPGEVDAVVELHPDPELGTVDDLSSGVRLANGALITLEGGKLADAAVEFVAEGLRDWVRVGTVLIEPTEDSSDHDTEELPERLLSDEPGHWQIELWAWPRAERLTTLEERIAAIAATPRMGFYSEWLGHPDGIRVLGAVVADAPAEVLGPLLLDVAEIGHLWAVLPPRQLAGWLAERDAAVEAAVLDALGSVVHPVSEESYATDVRTHLPERT